MSERNAFIAVLVKRLFRANRIPAVHPPPIPPLSKPGRGNPARPWTLLERPENASVGFWEMPLAKAAIFLSLAVLTLSAQAGVREVGAIGLTVAIWTVN